MNTAVLLQKSNQRAAMNWAARFATAESNSKLFIFFLDDSKLPFDSIERDSIPSTTIKNAVNSWLASAMSDGVDLRVCSVRSSDAAQSIQRAVDELEIDRLVLLRDKGVKSDSSEFELGRALFRSLPCEVVKLSIGESDGEHCHKILVGTGTGDATGRALQLAADMASNADARVQAVFVEPDDGDLAVDVAKRSTERVVADAVRTNRDRVDVNVIAGSDVVSGLRQAASDCQMVILGASHHSVIHRWLFSSVSEKLIAQHDGPTVAVLRPALAWQSRVSATVTHLISETVPQLDRSLRLNLFERIQAASQWNFDFIALICLSTVIATLGLLQNSAAVVIGAMLVAPLMTPLLGMGLAITQGNLILGRTSMRTVAFGFMCSFFIGWITAMIVPTAKITDQIAARGSPGVSDLFVAFFSGLAAAYAIGRPNLLSALPGVAIAAALVPPVASSAVAFSLQDTALAVGASLMFLTNIVAIVLGAALSFWLVGIRVMHSHGGFARWSSLVATVLLALAVALAIYEALPRDRGKHLLQAEAAQIVANDRFAQIEAIKVVGRRSSPTISILVSAPAQLSEETRTRLVAKALDCFPNASHVEVRFEQVWLYPGESP